MKLYPLVGGGRRNYRHCYIHQLVMEAFVGPCPPGLEVCHEDGDPSNNSLDNLRYDTHESNIADRTRHGRSFAWGRKVVAKPA